MTLSVLVQQDRIWVGLSRVNEFQEIPKKGDQQDWEKFETTLKEHKASAFFADRQDLEIAAESTQASPVAYQDIIHAMDEAVKVGLPEEELLLARRRVERLVSDATISDPSTLDDKELNAVVETLVSEEHEVSASRTVVMGVLDTVQAELKRRYKDDPSLALR